MAQQGSRKSFSYCSLQPLQAGQYPLFFINSRTKFIFGQSSFRSPDYFGLMILGLTAVAAFSSKGNFLKAMMMVVLGLMLASVGQDTLSDIPRFTFNNMNHQTVCFSCYGYFAMSEALTIIFKVNDPTKQQNKFHYLS